MSEKNVFALLLINTIPGTVPEAKLPPGLPVTIPRATDTSSIRNATVPAAILIPRQRVRESIRLGGLPVPITAELIIPAVIRVRVPTADIMTPPTRQI